MGSSTLTLYHESEQSLPSVLTDPPQDPWEVVIVYRGTNRRGGGKPVVHKSDLTQTEAEAKADELRLQYAETDDVLNVVARPVQTDEEPLPRYFYPRPKTSDEAFSLIGQVLRDSDALIAAGRMAP